MRTAARAPYATSSDAAKALHDWAVEAADWEYGFHPAHKTPVPDRIPIAHEPGYRTDLIGSWDEGLFFAGYWGMTYLHEFDHDGNHVRSRIAIAEQQLGTADVTACMTRLRDIVDALPGRRFGDIEVPAFQRPARRQEVGTVRRDRRPRHPARGDAAGPSRLRPALGRSLRHVTRGTTERQRTLKSTMHPIFEHCYYRA